MPLLAHQPEEEDAARLVRWLRINLAVDLAEVLPPLGPRERRWLPVLCLVGARVDPMDVAAALVAAVAAHRQSKTHTPRPAAAPAVVVAAADVAAVVVVAPAAAAAVTPTNSETKI